MIKNMVMQVETSRDVIFLEDCHKYNIGTDFSYDAMYGSIYFFEAKATTYGLMKTSDEFAAELKFEFIRTADILVTVDGLTDRYCYSPIHDALNTNKEFKQSHKNHEYLAYIRSLYVPPVYSNRGIERYILKDIEEVIDYCFRLDFGYILADLTTEDFEAGGVYEDFIAHDFEPVGSDAVIKKVY